MCLYVKDSITLSKREAIKKCKKIAKKDIITYKIVKSSTDKSVFLSQYKNFKYKIGEHIYQTGRKFSFYKKSDYMFLAIHRGLHSYRTLKRVQRDWKAYNYYGNLHILECTIPKGSEYYEGEHDLVSDNLIIVKKLR